MSERTHEISVTMTVSMPVNVKITYRVTDSGLVDLVAGETTSEDLKLESVERTPTQSHITERTVFECMGDEDSNHLDFITQRAASTTLVRFNAANAAAARERNA